MITPRTEVSGGDDHLSRNFPRQVKVVLQRVGELWMVSHTVEKYLLREHCILRVGKTWQDQGIYPEKRGEKAIGAVQVHPELIAKNAGSYAHHSLAVTR
jgi:hypothetical protein